MCEYADGPFQMDEDMPLEGSDFVENLPSLAAERLIPSVFDAAPLTASKGSESGLGGENHISDFQSCLILAVQSVPHLITELGRLETEEGAGTTVEENEMAYEEDEDDKLEQDTANRLHAESTALQVAVQSLPLTPPENFAPVINQMYRSSYPQTQNFPFLKKLQLRSVLCLIPEEYPQSHEEFFQREGIKLFQLGMAGNKEPFVEISSDLITEAMKVVINPENQPILIHCNRGKHRTGCLVGVLRRLQGWSLAIIFDEYRKFAAPKERSMDQQFIELYDQTEILRYAEEHRYVPLTWG